MSTILVADDREQVRASLRYLLEDNNYQVVEASSVEDAKHLMRKQIPDLIILDMNYELDTTSGREGLAFLEWLSKSNFSCPVLPMTAWSNTSLVVEAMNLGAKDFIEKPWNNHQLLNAIATQLKLSKAQYQNIKLKQQLGDSQQSNYTWRSPSMKKLFEQLAIVSKTDANILLTGENGTGKSTVAKFIHNQSQLEEANMIQVNMGAVPESLFESEMFGHIKGAFTDAKQTRIGRFELANDGSLFLDEIGNLSLVNQAKLLRVLESGQFEPVGGAVTKNSNARIIAATNANLKANIAQGLFREDLYFRLNTLSFHIPALKDREADIIPLASFFLQKFSSKYNKSGLQLHANVHSSLESYHWPGNVRELSHCIERAVLLCTDKHIYKSDLNLSVVQQEPFLGNMTLAEAEKLVILNTLERSNNNVVDAALILGLTKSSLYRRMEKYHLGKD